jgi:hypothetical protein
LRVWRIFVAVAVVAAALVVGAGTASADVLFSDGFESGNFSAWSLVKTGGGGSAVVQSTTVKTGAYAAQLSESSASGSKAYVRDTFTPAQQDLTASGDFQVTQQGASGGNVPFLRFFTSGGTRIISLYRQNVSGKIQVNYGGANFASSATLLLNTWANLQLHVITAGATSTVQVLKDSQLIYQTTSASLGTTGVSTVQIGNDTAAQAGTIVADNINVQSGGSPPSNTALPTITGEAEVGLALSASVGSWSGSQPLIPSYQWQRCDTNGANCTLVGSNSSTYTLAPADFGFTIVVAVTESNSAGSATASSVPTAPVSLSPPTNTTAPLISGTAQQGQTLTTTTGVWNGSPTINYVEQWQRCDANGLNCANTGVSGQNYPLTSADVGFTIVVAVTASNSAGSETTMSLPTAVVQVGSNTLFSDDFESGPSFQAWWVKKTGGDGTASVQSTTVKTGTYAAQLSETSNSGSLAYVRTTLGGAATPSPQVDLTATGDFNVLQQGASGGNVPFFRFFTSGGTRIITLYRQNGTAKVQVGYGGGNFASSATVLLNTWYNVQLHVIVNGTASTVQVLLNGTLVYSTTSASLGTTPVASLQLGNETAAQAGTIVADNITAQTSNSGPPVNTAPPAILGSAQQGQTLTASPGGWSGAQPINYTAYQWQRCDANGANCTNVGTDPSYTLTSADVGSTIVVAVTASNSAGTLTAPSAPTMVVWTSSVVALWHMDEASGTTTMFDSAGQNNGMLMGSVTAGVSPGFSNTAYGFDGSSSYVSVPSADSMNPGSGNFSFTIALQTTGTPPPSPQDWDLIRKGDITTAGGEYKMEFQSTGQASCGFKGTHYAELVAGPKLNDGKWHTVTCVKTSSDIEIIVDGETFATPATVGPISNTAPVIIGSHPGADWYQGSLDEANISIGS